MKQTDLKKCNFWKSCITFVIGPEILPLGCPDAPPETELFGLAPGAASLVRLALKAVILCDAPGAKVNCSRSSTLVRPLAKKVGKKYGLILES